MYGKKVFQRSVAIFEVPRRTFAASSHIFFCEVTLAKLMTKGFACL